MVNIVVLTKFKDKYTGEVYLPGRVLAVSPERAEEILATLPPGFVAPLAADEQPEEVANEQPEETANEQPKKTAKNKGDKKR